MHFPFFQVLPKLKYSFLLIFHYYFFVIVFGKRDTKMTSRSLFVGKEHNLNSNCQDKSDLEDFRNTYYNRRARVVQAGGLLVTISCGDGTDHSLDNPSPSCIYNNYLNSCVRSGALKPNFKIENLFPESFMKSLFGDFDKNTEGIMKHDTFTSELVSTKQTYSMQSISNSNNSSHEGFLKVEYERSKSLAAWTFHESTAAIARLPKFGKDVQKHDVIKASTWKKPAQKGNMALSRRTKQSNALPKKISTSKQTLITQNYKILKRPSVTYSKQSLSKSESLPINTMTEAEMLEKEKNKFEEIVSRIIQEDLDCSTKSTLKCEPDFPTIPKVLANDFSKIIMSISKDNCNSDLKNLEHDVNWVYLSNAGSSFKTFESSSHWGHDQLFSSNRKQTKLQENDSYNDYQCNKTMSKDDAENRTMRSRSDSGIFLDSNFERNSPDPDGQKFGVQGLSSVSGINSSFSSCSDNSTKVCYLCNNVVLNKFFLASRFGLLLNCLHTFCYSCIRNHCKSQRLSAGLVECPECGKHSPGIVSSKQWIEDMNEKLALFQKYEKESENFRDKQQVFFKNYLFNLI